MCRRFQTRPERRPCARHSESRESRLCRSARCAGRSGRERGVTGAQAHRRVALAAGGRNRGDHLPVHQSAVHVALLPRLYAAQHRVLLPADRVHAALYVCDLPGQHDRAARQNSLVRRAAVPLHRHLRRLPDVQRAQGGRARLGVRRHPPAGDGRGPRHVGHADGGAAPHRRLEPAAERPALHRLSAVRRCALARAGAGKPVHRGAGDRLPRALQRKPARHSDPGLRRDRHRLPDFRHRIDDDRCRQVLHQSRLRSVRHVSGVARPRSAFSPAGCSA